MELSLKPVRASRAGGFQGPYGGSQLVLTLYRIYIFCFQMCNRLPEIVKNGDAGIFLVYYSLKGAVYTVWIFIYSCKFLELFLFAKKRKSLYDYRAGFIVFPGLPLALLFYTRALIGRTDGA